MAALRRRPGGVALFPTRSNHPSQRRLARRSMGVEAEREGPAAVRHAAGRVPEHAADDRRRALREHAVQPRRGARRRHRQASSGASIPRPTKTASRRTARASSHRGVAAWRDSGRAAHLPQRPLPADLARREDRPAGRRLRHKTARSTSAKAWSGPSTRSTTPTPRRRSSTRTWSSSATASAIA